MWLNMMCDSEANRSGSPAAAPRQLVTELAAHRPVAPGY